MRLLVLICNAVSLAFTLLVLATDGPPTKPVYIVFGLLLILIPILTRWRGKREVKHEY
jgi:hypothetical protein